MNNFKANSSDYMFSANQLGLPVMRQTTDHLAGMARPDNKETITSDSVMDQSRGFESDSFTTDHMDEASEYSDDFGESDDETLADDRNKKSGISLRSRINRHPIQDRPRQKRQTLQDMARPLKQWLYRNKNNPYPTKAEKMNLAVGSQMTLTQVSNWFANARRRLKNTVRRPGISWSSRIKMYNSHVEGNAELLSISSEDSGSICWSDEERTVTEHDEDNGLQNISERLPAPGQNELKRKHSDVWNENNPKADDNYSSPFYRPIRDNKTSYVTPGDQSQHSFLSRSEVTSAPGKFKNSIMQRYLNDAYQHTFTMTQQSEQRRRNPSRGSMGSHDYEEMSSSSRSSPITDHLGSLMHDDSTEELESFIKQRRLSERESEDSELYWKEISAAMALTNLARSHHSGSPSCF